MDKWCTFEINKGGKLKKYLAIILAVVLISACGGNSEAQREFEVIKGEKTVNIDVNWASLPKNQDIATTTPYGVQQIIPISIEDFGVNSETVVFDPGVSAMYYDIRNLSTESDISTFEVTISINVGGIIEKLTTLTISDLQNTSALGGDLAKIPIYTSDDTSEVNFNALIGMNQSIIAQGRIIIQMDIVGRNINLGANEDFDIVLTLELEGKTEQ